MWFFSGFPFPKFTHSLVLNAERGYISEECSGFMVVGGSTVIWARDHFYLRRLIPTIQHNWIPGHTPDQLPSFPQNLITWSQEARRASITSQSKMIFILWHQEGTTGRGHISGMLRYYCSRGRCGEHFPALRRGRQNICLRISCCFTEGSRRLDGILLCQSLRTYQFYFEKQIIRNVSEF